jgi:hypothetical protein
MDHIIDRNAETDGLYVTYFLIGHQKGPTTCFWRVPGTWGE